MRGPEKLNPLSLHLDLALVLPTRNNFPEKLIIHSILTKNAEVEAIARAVEAQMKGEKVSPIDPRKPLSDVTKVSGEVEAINEEREKEAQRIAKLEEREQQDEIERLRRYENTLIPETLDFSNIEGLSNEIKQKLTDARPQTLARASRVPGVTPAAVSLLLVYMKKHGMLERLNVA